MPLETPVFISDLVASNPPATDQKSEGAAHLRNIKSAIKTTFPNVTGAVNPTQAEFNHVTGVTSSLQTQLNTKSPSVSPVFTTAATLPAATTIGTVTADEISRLSGVSSAIQTQLNSKAATASPTFTGTVTLPATGLGATEATTKGYVDGVAFATTLPAQAGNAGRVIATDGTTATWTPLKTVNSLTLVGAGNIVLQATPIVRKAFITSSTTHTIPAGVLVARPYAVGAGSAGVTSTQSGAGGGIAYGDIAVVAGDVLTINIAAGVATLIKGGITMLTANAASGIVGGTASKNAAVTNGGNFSGGNGFTAAAAGGGSSGSPLGAGVAGSGLAGGNIFGGSGWGGASVASGGGGGVGGAGSTVKGGNGLTIPSIEPLLVGLEGLGGGSGNPGQLGAGGGAGGGTNGASGGGFGGGGGSGAGGAGTVGNAGGFGGGGGGIGATDGTAGAGGFGGGGGSGNSGTPTGGAGGAAAVLIFY